MHIIEMHKRGRVFGSANPTTRVGNAGGIIVSVRGWALLNIRVISDSRRKHMSNVTLLGIFLDGTVCSQSAMNCLERMAISHEDGQIGAI